jgi:hypothetical protein
MDRKTSDPQTVDSDRANAEWKAGSGLQDITHGADGKVVNCLEAVLSEILFELTRVHRVRT